MTSGTLAKIVDGKTFILLILSFVSYNGFSVLIFFVFKIEKDPVLVFDRRYHNFEDLLTYSFFLR